LTGFINISYVYEVMRVFSHSKLRMSAAVNPERIAVGDAE
jgi:hypothetical protein